MFPRDLQPQAGTAFIEKLNPRPLQNRDDLAEGVRPRADRAVESFHSANGAKRDPGLFRKRALRPPEKGAGGAYVSSGYDDQKEKVPRRSL